MHLTISMYICSCNKETEVIGAEKRLGNNLFVNTSMPDNKIVFKPTGTRLNVSGLTRINICFTPMD